MNDENGTLPSVSTIKKKANATGGGYGVVIHSFDSQNKNSAQSIVYVDHNRPLYVVPRYLFDITYLTNQGFSKSQVNKRSIELGFGANIQFESRGNQIVYFDRCSKGQDWIKMGEQLLLQEKDRRFFFEDKFIDAKNANILLRAQGCVSDEEVRRFFCHSFHSVDSLRVPYAELQKVIPNVLYDLFVNIDLDMHGYEPNMESAHCQPTFSLSFNRWHKALRCEFEKIRAAPWHNIPVPRITSINLRYIIRAINPPPAVYSLCGVLISEKEVFCPCFSDFRCVLALVMEHDVTLRIGSVLHFNMFYSFHNNFYVIYDYWHKNSTKKGFGIENPMQIRLTNNGYEFLAYVKRIKFNNFYASASLPMIYDPKNILHGYFPVDDESIASSEDERFQGVGIPVWVKYLQEKANRKNPMRFEVVSIAEKEQRANEDGTKIKLRKCLKDSFISSGFLLNRRGTIYCPHITNFPFIWAKPDVEVGTFFQFSAEFVKAKSRYEIQEIVKVICDCPFDVVKLTKEEDAFSFQIPLSTNFYYSTYLAVDFSRVGFVEGSDEIITFLRAVGRAVPIWCRENSDFHGRVTPLICMSIEQPLDMDRNLKRNEDNAIRNEQQTKANFQLAQLVPDVPLREDEHLLEHSYIFSYFMRPQGKFDPEDYAMYVQPVSKISSVEQFWQVYRFIKRPSDLAEKVDFHLFKEGVKPVWEDPSNRNGGKWILRLKKGLSSRIWENLLLAMIGEQFLVGDEVVGAVCSVRNQEDIVSLWNRTADSHPVTNRIRDTLRRVLNLPTNTVLEYKRHDDCLRDQRSYCHTSASVGQQTHAHYQNHHHQQQQMGGGRGGVK
ncbi:hypothetical protein niasHT_003827 [Heterodera trifolii]|uniref:eIF-4F 25 kDa subunit n=1 Tax=Heterodera trifolii TaxID=157864 RepID=A0ABD2LV31_9BILA